jgi:hypothetical protein
MEMFLRMSFFLLAIVCLPLRAQDEIPDLSPYAGTYEGLVLNGPGLEPITTILRLASGGRLVGEYVINSAEGDKPGTVSNVYLEAPGTLTLEWTDKDGEGFARLEFASDYRSFNGGWGTYDTEADNPWNGRRQ